MASDEALEGPGLDELPAEVVVLLGGAVAPVDRVRLGELREALDPVEELLVRGRGHRCFRHGFAVSFYAGGALSVTGASLNCAAK